MSLTLLALLVACSGSPEPPTVTASPASAPAVGPNPAPAAPANAPQDGLPAGEGFADPGGQHPPIPPKTPCGNGMPEDSSPTRGGTGSTTGPMSGCALRAISPQRGGTAPGCSLSMVT